MSNDRHINFKLLRDRVLGGRTKPVRPNSTGATLKNWLTLRSLKSLCAANFPMQAEEWNDPVERRTFLKLMGASLALAGLSGCVIQPPEKVIPYVKQPEEETPGQGLYSSPPLIHWAESPRLCSCAATKDDPPKLKEIQITPAMPMLNGDGHLLAGFGPDAL